MSRNSKKKALKKDGLYVVKLKDERSVDLLRELKKYEVHMLNTGVYLTRILKVLVVLISVLIPPLLLVTIPLLKEKKV